MSEGVELREISEGLVRLFVPDVPRGKGPGKRGGGPFYNPTMEKNRDMTVLFLRALGRSNLTFLDGLSAAGSLGIRVAKEVAHIEVTCNDSDPSAAALIKKNAEANQVELAAVTNEKFQAHMAVNSYDFIDIDPFGTPVPFLDSAFQAAARGGIVAVTATDTAVLCGAQAKACVRRYEARPLHIDCCKEIALRILIGFCVRTAARHDRALRPLLSFSSDHYFRLFLGVEHGAGKADEALAGLGYVLYDKETGEGRMVVEKGQSRDWAGPLWTGNLLDRGSVERLHPATYMLHPTSILVDALKSEVGAPGLYVTSEGLARHLGISPPPLGTFIDTLHAHGNIAIRTHFDPGGVKTDASWDEVTRTYGDCST